MSDERPSDKPVDYHKDIAFFEPLVAVWSIYPITVIGNILLCVISIRFLIPYLFCRDLYGICVFFIIGGWIGVFFIPGLMALLSGVLIPIDHAFKRSFSEQLMEARENMEKSFETLDPSVLTPLSEEDTWKRRKP